MKFREFVSFAAYGKLLKVFNLYSDVYLIKVVWVLLGFSM